MNLLICLRLRNRKFQKITLCNIYSFDVGHVMSVVKRTTKKKEIPMNFIFILFTFIALK